LQRPPTHSSDDLMAAVDAINARFGRGTIYPAAAGITRACRRSTRHASTSCRRYGPDRQTVILPVVNPGANGRPPTRLAPDCHSGAVSEDGAALAAGL